MQKQRLFPHCLGRKCGSTWELEGSRRPNGSHKWRASLLGSFSLLLLLLLLSLCSAAACCRGDRQDTLCVVRLSRKSIWSSHLSTQHVAFFSWRSRCESGERVSLWRESNHKRTQTFLSRPLDRPCDKEVADWKAKIKLKTSDLSSSDWTFASASRHWIESVFSSSLKHFGVKRMILWHQSVKHAPHPLWRPASLLICLALALVLASSSFSSTSVVSHWWLDMWVRLSGACECESRAGIWNRKLPASS